MTSLKNNQSKIILSWNLLQKKINQWRNKGYKVVFTNGCFDILHFGHVSYLENAKKNKQILIVAVNSDDSVKRLKGSDRPINNEKARAFVLAALACVDFVTTFKEDTPLKLIETLRPDILIKGADWQKKEVVGADFMRSYGGKVKFIDYIQDFSTTAIIAKIKKE